MMLSHGLSKADTSVGTSHATNFITPMPQIIPKASGYSIFVFHLNLVWMTSLDEVKIGALSVLVIIAFGHKGWDYECACCIAISILS
jgi:hypothetical protein